eukprot:CAMPEP_0183336136 /NCGR_PEP_ID=MMETSP0164_2-20130417/4205_1 /TAXON_ID=221442 /ORGANISM="Coccolithus pelagicus ssp braarudi, Strain PLY182g" /LENGTH=389 /DNA_ID=CAMNT_0025505605 /DNA_START=105 /DNA_END=1274 /DNA_ORIENTATION=+
MPRVQLVGDDNSLFESLRARQAQLDAQQRAIDARWRNSACSSSVRVELDDWVRRLALDWPLAALGTAQGSVRVVDLQTGQTLAQALGAHPSRTNGIARDMRLLFGEFDGGGPTAIAFRFGRVVSAGRDGGAREWRLTDAMADKPVQLQHVADLPCESIVSSIAICEPDNAVWTAGLDGRLCKWTAVVQGADAHCALTIDVGSPVLCLTASDTHGLVVCGTADGSVHIFSMTTGNRVDVWRPLSFDGSSGYRGERTRSVALLDVGSAACVLAGGSEGQLHFRWLADGGLRHPDGDSAGVFDATRPSQALLPAHRGAVVALQGVGVSSLFVSGAHDGTMRVWDMRSAASGGTPKALYGMGGYKVWLGSVATDGKRLVSDGSDNCVIVHAFD